MKAMALNKQSPIEERPLSLIEKPGSIGDVYLFLFSKLIGSSLKSKFLVLSLLRRNLVIAIGEETRYYYHYDALGSTIALL